MARLPEAFDPHAPLNSCEAVAEFLHLSRGLVYKQAGEGGLPGIRIGSRLMVRTAPLLASLGLDDPEPGEHACSGCRERGES